MYYITLYLVNSKIIRIFVKIKIMSEEQQIQEILLEASAYGLRFEVEETAKQFIKENPNMDRVLAYQCGYEDWIK